MKEYSIQDFARRIGISMDRLRNYEKLGIITPRRNEQNNYRYYTDYDFLDLQRVCMLQSIGVPLRQTLPEQHLYSPASFRQ